MASMLPKIEAIDGFDDVEPAVAAAPEPRRRFPFGGDAAADRDAPPPLYGDPIDFLPLEPITDEVPDLPASALPEGRTELKLPPLPPEATPPPPQAAPPPSSSSAPPAARPRARPQAPPEAKPPARPRPKLRRETVAAPPPQPAAQPARAEPAAKPKTERLPPRLRGDAGEDGEQTKRRPPRRRQRAKPEGDGSKPEGDKRLPPRLRKQTEQAEAPTETATPAPPQPLTPAAPAMPPKPESAAQDAAPALPPRPQLPPRPASPPAETPSSATEAPPRLPPRPGMPPSLPAPPVTQAAPVPEASPSAALPPPQPVQRDLPPPPLPEELRPKNMVVREALLNTEPSVEVTGGGAGKPPTPPMAMEMAAAEAGEALPVRSPADSGQGELASLRHATDLSNCLLPLLGALNWRGDPRHVAEAVPHFIDALDITSFRNIMATLHFQSRPVPVRLDKIDERLFPCLFLPENNDAMILLSREGNEFVVFHGGENAEVRVPRARLNGLAYFFSRLEEDELAPAQAKVGWFKAVNERFRSLFYQTLGITFVLNVLALVTPLFVMAVYDKVVATGSLITLAYFAVGVSIAIGCDLILRGIRTRILAFIGARLDNIVGIAIFHKIMFLPPAFTERATIGAQIARIKDFETIREFFTGPMALVLFELPFVIIFVITIAALAGPVAFVPIIMIACYVILGMIIMPLLRGSVSRAGRASSKKQELTVETLGGMRAVKYTGAEETWMERFRDLSATASLNSFYTAQFSSLLQTMSHVLMISAGIGTIVFGVFRVLAGDMTVGGLVASMILVWRVLAPLQTGFVSMTRLTQVKSSITQINNLMNIRAERDQHSIVNPIRRMDGFVTFARVSIRYSPEADPALVGVSFDAEPGEIIAVVGGNGSGKSTVLKLMIGMYQPQAGSIRIDNMDIRQMDVVELRHACAYVPQAMQFFYGTIAQNMRLSHPTATEADLHRACAQAEVLDEVLALEQGSGKWQRKGFEVRIGDSGAGQMPTSMLQRLNLARGYLKDAPIMLLDEPGNGLDFAGDQAFMRAMDDLRGRTTVLMVTHRPSHLRIADKILWLEYGNVRAYGPAAEVIKQMPKDFV